MGVVSGIGGAVNGHSCVRNWSINYTSELAAYAASNTAGAQNNLLGNTDWSGSFGAYGHTPAVMPGEALSFTGSIDGTKGAAGTAIVDSVEITCDIEGGKPIEYTVNFSANGALTLGAAVAADSDLTTPPTSVGCKVATGTVIAVPVWSDMEDVRNWKLTISAVNSAYVSSSTSGGKRRKKGTLNLTFAIGVYSADFSALPAPNAIAAFRFYVAAASYWEVLWGIYADASGLQVDREGGGLVGATLNGRLRTQTLVGSTDTRGAIKKPGGTTWWPGA
jgi:hypothetical protein